MMKNKERIMTTAWYLFVFGFLYIWFTRVHPLVPFDSDDWLYLAYIRRGIPLWGDWNPAKLFPETLMPMVCSTAAQLLYPHTGDYAGAITVGSAVVVSLFITVYVYAFTRMIQRVFLLSGPVSVVISIFFFLLHFLALRSEESGNQYMFYCWDLNCYYNYLIPGLLNASLVMVMTKNEQFDAFWHGDGEKIKKGLFLFAVYLAVFSNLASSGILAVFAGSRVLFALVERIRKRITWKEFFKSTSLHIGILVLWLLSAVFELSGGRAGQASGGAGMFVQGIKSSIEALSHPTVYSGKSFLAVSFLILLAMAALWLLNRKKDAFNGEFLSLFGGFLVCGAVLLVYMILLMAKVDWTSVYRSEYLFCLFFYLFLLIMFSLCYVLRRYPNGILVVPVLLYVMLTCVNTTGQTFLESNMDNYPAEVCAGLTNDLVEQFVQADEAGLEHFELYVPVFPKEQNWPMFSGYNGFAIGDSLYEHGVTSRRIEFTAVPTMEMNEKYHLGLFE